MDRLRIVGIIALIAVLMIYIDEIQAFFGTDEERCGWAEERLSGTETQSGSSFWKGYRDTTCD